MRYDAVEFLEALFRPTPEVDPSDLPADWFVVWDERAAIMEYDGQMSRERAEFFALRDVMKQMNDERTTGGNSGGES